MALCVTSAQVNPGFSQSFGSASSQPRSFKVLTKAGFPSYLRVPRTRVSASGDIVELLEGYRVTIRISYKIIAIKNEVGFGNTHEIFT